MINLFLSKENVNGDGIIQYTGASADTPGILTNALNDQGNFLNFPNTYHQILHPPNNQQSYNQILRYLHKISKTLVYNI